MAKTRAKTDRADFLPLFPLDLVLFPGRPLPLHIFEPRYKEMVAECWAEKKPFGILRAHGNRLAEIGCTAEIIDILEKLPDGRMNILTVGRRRFAVSSVVEGRAFLRGVPEYLADVPPADELALRHAQDEALRLHAELMLLVDRPVTALEPGDSQLSYVLGESLPLDLDFKQGLLRLSSEPERIEVLLKFYKKVLPRVKELTMKSALRDGYVN